MNDGINNLYQRFLLEGSFSLDNKQIEHNVEDPIVRLVKSILPLTL